SCGRPARYRRIRRPTSRSVEAFSPFGAVRAPIGTQEQTMNTSRNILALTLGLAVAAAGSVVAAQSGYRPNDGQRLSGTYQLDQGKSDRPQQVANDVTRSLGSDERDRVAQNLMDRLES